MIIKLFRNIIKIVGYAAVMLALNIHMALLSFVLLPVVGGLIVAFRILARRAFQVSKTRLTRLNTFLSENLSGMRITQIFRRESEKYKEFSEKSNSYLASGMKEMHVNAFFRPLVYFLSVIALAIILRGGSQSVIGGIISIGTLYVFVQYIQHIFEPIQEFAEQLTMLQSAVASAEKIFTLLDTEPSIIDPVQPETIPEIRGRIEFQHVWFAYENMNGNAVGS